jgi:hypothetical protein
MPEPTRHELAEQLSDVLWAIHRYRSNKGEDERMGDVADIVEAALDDLGARGVPDVDDLHEPLEYVCLNIAGLWGWAEAVDELMEDIAEHLDQQTD